MCATRSFWCLQKRCMFPWSGWSAIPISFRKYRKRKRHKTLCAEIFFANENLPAILGSQGGSFVSGKGGRAGSWRHGKIRFALFLALCWLRMVFLGALPLKPCGILKKAGENFRAAPPCSLFRVILRAGAFLEFLAAAARARIVRANLLALANRPLYVGIVRVRGGGLRHLLALRLLLRADAHR